MSTTVFDTLTELPCAITAGEAVTWSESPTDFPPASYAIAYEFAGQTPQDGYQSFEIVGSESGSAYTFVFPVTVKPGIYHWQKRVTQSSDSRKAVIAQGTLTIRANLSIPPTATPEALQLALMNSVITAFATTADQSVSFNGQSFSRGNIKEYQDAQTRLQAIVYKQQQAILGLSGQANNPRVSLRFVPAQGWDYRGGFPQMNYPRNG